jgi:integrase
VRYFLQWARGRGLAGDLNVPLPPRQEPERLLPEREHIHQLDRCLTDDVMPLDLRVGGALVLLFGMLVSRITQLTKDDVIEDGQTTWLAIDGHRLLLPAKLAHLVRQLRDQDEPRWTLGRLGGPVPWLFPGQSPARPAVDVLFGGHQHQHRRALVPVGQARLGAYVGQRTADDRGDIGSTRKLTNPTH